MMNVLEVVNRLEELGAWPPSPIPTSGKSKVFTVKSLTRHLSGHRAVTATAML